MKSLTSIGGLLFESTRAPSTHHGIPTSSRVYRLAARWRLALIRADYPLDAFNHARSLQRRAGPDRPLRDRQRDQHLGQVKRHLIGV